MANGDNQPEIDAACTIVAKQEEKIFPCWDRPLTSISHFWRFYFSTMTSTLHAGTNNEASEWQRHAKFTVKRNTNQEGRNKTFPSHTHSCKTPMCEPFNIETTSQILAFKSMMHRRPFYANQFDGSIAWWLDFAFFGVKVAILVDFHW